MEINYSDAQVKINPPSLGLKPEINISNKSKLTVPDKSAYHAQSLNQSNISFYYSLIGGAIGFLVIIVSLISSTDKAWIGLVSGGIIDGVSVLLFSQTNKTQKVMIDFFDKLRIDSNLTESRDLCNSIDDSVIKDRLKVKLSLFYAGIDGETLQKCSEEIICDSQNCNKK